jgi:hypothetical protein
MNGSNVTKNFTPADEEKQLQSKKPLCLSVHVVSSAGRQLFLLHFGSFTPLPFSLSGLQILQLSPQLPSFYRY